MGAWATIWAFIPARLAADNSRSSILSFLTRSEKQIAVESREIAVDLQLLDDRLDSIDGRPVALGRQKRATLAVPFFNLGEAVVDRVGKMRRRDFRHTAGNLPILQDHDLLARLRQQVRGRQSGDAGAHDAHISIDVRRQLRTTWTSCWLRPKRIAYPPVAVLRCVSS